MDEQFSGDQNKPRIHGARLGRQPVIKPDHPVFGKTKYVDKIYPAGFYPPYVSGAGIFLNRIAMQMILWQLRVKSYTFHLKEALNFEQ